MSPPTVDPITGPTGTVSGTAPAGATVIVTDANGATLCTTTASQGGTYTCALSPALAAGDQVTVTAVGSGGLSATTTVSVPAVGTPVSPTVDPIVAGTNGSTTMPNSTTVSGRAAPGSTLVVTNSGGGTCTATADVNGFYSCVLSPAVVPGDTVTVTSTDANGQSATSTSTVAPPAPSVNPTDGTTVSGTALPGATVAVKDANGNVVGSATADSSGVFTVPVNLANGAVVHVETVVRGVPSTPATATVVRSGQTGGGQTGGSGGSGGGAGAAPAGSGATWPMPTPFAAPAADLSVRPEYAPAHPGMISVYVGGHQVPVQSGETTDHLGVQALVDERDTGTWMIALRPARLTVVVPAKFAGKAPVTTVVDPVDDEQVLHVTRGQTVRASGTGLAPHSLVTVYLVETGAFLGTIETDAEGAFTHDFAIAATTPLGVRTVQVIGSSPTALTRVLSVSTLVDAPQQAMSYRWNKPALTPASARALRASVDGSGATHVQVRQYQANTARGAYLAKARTQAVTRILTKAGMRVDVRIVPLKVSKVRATRFTYIQLVKDPVR